MYNFIGIVYLNYYQINILKQNYDKTGRKGTLNRELHGTLHSFNLGKIVFIHF